MKQQLFFLLFLLGMNHVHAQIPEAHILSVDTFLVYELSTKNDPALDECSIYPNREIAWTTISKVIKIKLLIVNGQDSSFSSKEKKILLYYLPVGDLDYFINYPEAKQNPGKKIYYINKEGEEYTQTNKYYSKFFLKDIKDTYRFWLRYDEASDSFDYGSEKISSTSDPAGIISLSILCLIALIIVYKLTRTQKKGDFLNKRNYLENITVVLLFSLVANICVGVVFIIVDYLFIDYHYPDNINRAFSWGICYAIIMLPSLVLVLLPGSYQKKTIGHLNLDLLRIQVFY